MERRHKGRKGVLRDIEDFEPETHYCAFDSLETFNSLVYKKEIKFLLLQGFKVLMLTVTDILKGEHQVAYRKEDVIETKDISSLFI